MCLLCSPVLIRGSAIVKLPDFLLSSWFDRDRIRRGNGPYTRGANLPARSPIHELRRASSSSNSYHSSLTSGVLKEPPTLVGSCVPRQREVSYVLHCPTSFWLWDEQS